jgi:uncharacterized membrane protein YjgN (DUF898 family)
MEFHAQDDWQAVGASDEQLLKVRFTGSGSEYFRIWIVNLLLSIVTLSLYRPWAKVRRLKYFYANTLVGEHALDFHGDPLKMLRGYLLVGAMVFTYSMAGRFSPLAALVAFGAMCVLWPALLRASMQFRLANTSWRGLRFRFSGTLGGAYRAVLPLFVPALAFVAVGLLGPDARHVKGDAAAASKVLVLAGWAMLVAVAVTPFAWWSLKRYQHDHYALGQWQTRLTAGPGSFYGLSFKFIGVFLLALIPMAIAMAVVGAVIAATHGVVGDHPNKIVYTVIGMLGAGAMWLVMLLLPMPYITSRTQNLLWSRTRCQEVRFDSHLRFGDLLGLTFKNWVLMVLTLGLYWPFAAVAVYRARVEAVTPKVRGNLDTLRQDALQRANDASGDAAGDLFGIDIGL